MLQNLVGLDKMFTFFAQMFTFFGQMFGFFFEKVGKCCIFRRNLPFFGQNVAKFGEFGPFS